VQWRSSFIFTGAVRITHRITLHVFRTTSALFIDAVPLNKSLRTSRRYHWGWPKRQWTGGHIVCLGAVVVSSCVFTASTQLLKQAFLRAQQIKPRMKWHQRRLLGHIWGLDVLDQGQAPWPHRLSQYQLLEVLSWRENPFLELVVPEQILHLLAQCLFDCS